MMGERRVRQDALFYEFSLERHVPERHLLRSIDRFVELDGLRQELAPFYSEMGRPSIDPELLIRMLIVGYCFGIRSERRLCEEVHLNLAYRWFCGLGLDGEVPDHSTFSKNRMAVSATAICCAGCSKPCCNGASRRAWSAVKGLPLTPA
jgi:transposase